MSATDDWPLQACVAENPRCLPKLLEQMSHSTESHLLETLARNPNCPANLLEALFTLKNL